MGLNQTYPLRLPASLRRELEVIAKAECTSINHLITLSLAEKISRTEYRMQAQQNRWDRPTVLNKSRGN